MSAVESLLLELGKLDVKLWADGERLRYSAPEGALNASLIALMKAHKAELLPLLGQDNDRRANAIPQFPRDREILPSFGQERLWFLQQLEGASAAYNIPSAMRLMGRFDVDAARSAFHAILQRHEILRTSFEDRDGHCVVAIAPELTLDIPLVDLSGLSESDQAAEVKRLAHKESRYVFDLAKAPLIRSLILKLDAEEHVLLTTLHHIVSDGWSTAIFVREFSQLYEHYAHGKSVSLPLLPIQYADYAMHQRTTVSKESTASDLAYWKDLLAGVPPLLQLPTDRPRPNAQSFLGGSVPIRIDPLVANRLRQITRQTNATMYMTLLAAFAALLARYSGQTKIVIGSPIANRKYPEVEPLIGFFLNTLVMPVDVTGNPGFSELVARVRQIALDSYAHQDLPFEHLVEALHPVRTLSHSPIFQAMFVLQNNRTETLAIHGTQMQPIELEMSTEKFDLTLSLAENPDDSITGELGYSLDLFDSATADRMAGHLRNLLAAAAQDAEQPISKLSLLSPPERQRIVDEWNDTALPRPANICIHHLVEQQVERTPNAVALVFENQALTYCEYNERANQLAHFLASLGIGPEVRVGVCIDRSFEMMVALLAVWKAGAAYVPLDTSYPGERLAFMLEDAQVAVLLTLERHLEKLPNPSFPVICLDPSSPSSSALSDQPVHNLQSAVTPDNLAYIIYTSGSTGRPKGVMNAHRGVCNRLLWGQETLGLRADDSIIQKTPIGFDVSVWEMFWPLMVGARLVIAVPEGHRDSAYLVDLIRRHNVTTIHFVAPMLGGFLEEEEISACTTLRRIITSGEAVSPQLERRFFERLNIPFHDLYGPTEAAIEVSHWECKPDSELRAVPIGRPISNVQLYILDANLQPVPVGVTGELYIGGIAVARGYWKRPGLTASSFIPDPFSVLPGARLYRTGDGCRFLADGNIDFLGRLDQQIKIRGFRVELGEIETALQSFAEVREAVVLLRDRQLVAYVIPSVSDVVSHDLQGSLSKILPDHMIPSQFLFLDAFPIAPNGKLNRAALPTPQKVDAVKAIAPRTETERTLAAIWAEVLGVERVGIHDDFFQIGGDSISSTRIVARARQAGLRITLKQIFQHHTIAALAVNAECLDTPSPQLPEQIGAVPLTPIQHRFFKSFTVDPHHYNQAVLLETPGRLDERSIERALRQLVERHDALRLRFHREGVEWRQASKSSEKPVFERIPVAEEENWQDIVDRYIPQLHTRLNLSEGPLFCAAWFDRGRNTPGRLLLVVHHLAVDGVSWRILFDDLSRLLAEETLPPRQSVSFGQWASWLNEHAQSIAANELEYWRGVTRTQVIPLPLDFPSTPEENTFASVEGVTVELGIPETEELLRRSANAGIQIHEVLLAGVASTIANWSGGSTVLLEVEGHGRGEFSGAPDCTETVGWFTTTFPLALDLTDPDPRSIQDQWLAIPNHGAGYGVLRWLAKQDGLESLQEPQIAFNYLGRFDEAFSAVGSELKFAGESLGSVISPRALRQHALEVTAVIARGSLRVTWAFSRNLHRRETIERLARRCSDAIQTPLPEVAYYPLSISQLGILIETLARPGSGIHIEQSAWTIRGAFDPQQLISAFDRVLARHAVLRTGFFWEDRAEPLQAVHEQVSMPVRIEDWSAMPLGEQQENLTDFLKQDREHGFLLAAPPLLRLAIFRIADDAWKLVVTYHHLVLDGWSLALVLGDAMALYREQANLPVVRQYRDYISWLRRQDLGKAERWWREELKGFTHHTYLVSGALSHVPGSHHRTEKELPELLTRRIEEMARRCGVTLNTIVQATWAILLAWWSGECDVLFGQTVSGRPSEIDGVDTIVGMFINTVPIRCRITDTSSLSAFLQQVQTTMIGVDAVSFCSTAQIHQWSELSASLPLYQSILVFENYPVGHGDAASSLGFDVLEAQANGAQTNYPLTLLAAPGDSLRLCAIGAGSCWMPDMLHQLLNVWEALFTQAVEAPGSTIAQLRGCLPDAPSHAPEPERSGTRANVAPRTILEVQLAALWQDLLGIPNVGVRDNFFDLGGHSLLALRLVDRIAQQLHRPLPLSVLAQAGTIENLAQHLTENTSEFNPLVRLRHSHSIEPPLFCIHPLGGSVICYASLARLLPMERSIYGLQARGAEEGQDPAASIKEMADDYIRAILTVQPRGPYHLLGYSFGGYIALMMADFLQREGQEINGVILLDTPHPSVVPVEMRSTDTAGLLVSLFADSLDLSLQHLRSMDEERQLEFVYASAKEADLIPPGMSFDHARRYSEISRRNHSMDYTPVTYSFPITLIRASEQAERISDAPDLGWQSFSTLPVHVVWTPGMHETMLNPPFVETLANLTNDVLVRGGR